MLISLIKIRKLTDSMLLVLIVYGADEFFVRNTDCFQIKSYLSNSNAIDLLMCLFYSSKMALKWANHGRGGLNFFAHRACMALYEQTMGEGDLTAHRASMAPYAPGAFNLGIW